MSTIGENIKRLRREQDLTQEALAEYLGITSRAVSQWECERTAPDISQIPLLCSIFGVSADELLGIDTERREEEIRQIQEHSKHLIWDAQWPEAVAYLRAGLGKHPSSHKLMYALADALVNDYSRRGMKDYSEVIALCERVLAESTDSVLRSESLYLLGVAYGYAGDDAGMRRVAADMPSAHLSREAFMLYRQQGDKGYREMQEYLSFLTCQMLELLGLLANARHDDGTHIHAEEDRVALYKQSVGVLDLLYPDGDYHNMAQMGDIACAWLASMHLDRGDMDGFYRWLGRHVDFSLAMDAVVGDDLRHTSPAFCGLDAGGWIHEEGMSRSEDNYAAWMNHTIPPDSPVREDARFMAAMERLKNGK